MYDENVERPLNMRYAAVCVSVAMFEFLELDFGSLSLPAPFLLSFSLFFFYNFVALLWHCLLLGGVGSLTENILKMYAIRMLRHGGE